MSTMRARYILLSILAMVFAMSFPFDRRLDLIDNFVQMSTFLVWKCWANQPPASEAELLRLRSLYQLQRHLPTPTGLMSEEIFVSKGEGHESIPIFLTWPKKREQLMPLVVYFHPGGFVVGDHVDPVAYDIAKYADAIVASVGYRLAPEHKFPAGIDDCWEALLWLKQHSKDFGIDENRIAVAGLSAGGNIAAVTALRARDNGIALVAQALVLPMLRFGAQTRSHQEYGGLANFNSEAAVYFWLEYVDNRAACEHIYCQPILATSVKGVAPALVVVGSRDILRDEGVEYAELLRRDGVPLETMELSGTHVRAMITSTARIAVAKALGDIIRRAG